MRGVCVLVIAASAANIRQHVQDNGVIFLVHIAPWCPYLMRYVIYVVAVVYALACVCMYSRVYVCARGVLFLFPLEVIHTVFILFLYCTGTRMPGMEDFVLLAKGLLRKSEQKQGAHSSQRLAASGEDFSDVCFKART